MSTDIHTYTVHNDPEVVRQVDKAAYRAFWGSSLVQGSWSAIGLAVFAMGVYGAADVWASYYGAKQAFLFAAVLGLLVGYAAQYIEIVRHVRKESRREYDEVWECTMSQDDWTFRNRKGIGTIIPWAAMKLAAEFPDAWIVWYGNTSVLVFRKPLRAAGLEDDFLSRIPKT